MDENANPERIVKENSYMDEKMKSDGPSGSGEPAEELSVEQSFEKLESMVRMLESEDVTLESIQILITKTLIKRIIMRMNGKK